MKNPILFFLNYFWGPWKKFVIYQLRWQMGIILLPLMFLCLDYLKLPYWLSLVIFNIVGACIFFPIDKHIFGDKAKETKITTNDAEKKE